MVRSATEKSPATYVASVVWTICAGLLVWSDLAILAFFGTVLFLIYNFGLRDKFSNEETASAYSVFNENQQAIAGTLTAGQVDRQLRGGMNDGSGSIGNSSIAVANQSKTATTTTNVSQDERLRRRKAAALAAERRFQQNSQQPEEQ
mmetsp:Transcript_22403/g.55420  ORF Transcript_22403/g.55420 Transcript_22403/m.55420 type:complete len:147 (+) Transcript_22403:80-520(+)